MNETATASRPYPDKWARASATPTVEAFHTAIRKLGGGAVRRERKSWEEVVHDPDLELTREDFEKIEADLLATGYRFEMSATVSLKEEPDKYKPIEAATDSGQQEQDEEGRPILGSGDNVFKAPADVEGTARFVSDVERVMEMLTEGVPEETIAVIDDSGGTLTAPILGDFTAWSAWAARSARTSGILTREYNVPCLMNATLDGLSEGDRVTVEYSKPAADAYADAETAAAQRARVIKVSLRTRCPPSTAISELLETNEYLQKAATPSTASARRAPCRSRSCSRQPLHLAVVPERLVPLARAAAQDRRSDAGRGDRATAPARSVPTSTPSRWA